MDADELQQRLDSLAGELGCSVSLDAVDGSLLGYSSQRPGADVVRIEAILSRHVPDTVLAYQRSHGIDDATGPVAVPANAALGMEQRTCLPLWSGTRLVGHVWVLHPGADLDDDSLRSLEAAGHRLAELLGVEARVDPAELVADLFEEGSTTALLDMAAERTPAVAGRLVFLALAPVVDLRGRRAPAPTTAPTDVPHLRTELGRSTRHGRTLLVIGRPAGAGPGPGDVRHLLASVDQPCTLGWAAADARGDGDRENGEAALSTAAARAILAADCAAVDPALPATCGWDALGIYAHLLAAGPIAWDASSPAAASDRSAEMLRHTLEVYLDHAGSAARSIDALGIHRTTFYYRLDKISRMHGIDLDDGLARSGAHLALKAQRIRAARDRYAWSDRLAERACRPTSPPAPRTAHR